MSQKSLVMHWLPTADILPLKPSLTFLRSLYPVLLHAPLESSVTEEEVKGF